MNELRMLFLLATQFRLHFDKHRKTGFIAYVCIRLNRNPDEKSDICAKTEATFNSYTHYTHSGNRGTNVSDV